MDDGRICAQGSSAEDEENMQNCSYFAIMCDEVTTVDYVAWISIHSYIVRDYARVSMLLSLERITEGTTAPKLALCIKDAILGKGSIKVADMQAKWIAFGADGAAIFQVRTRWINMLSPLRRVIGEYKSLLVKMVEDRLDKGSTPSAREVARKNFELLSDVSVPCALTCFLPLFKTVHDLIKFSQQRDIFVCDYVAAIKVCQARLYELYSDSKTSFTTDEFTEFLTGRHHSMTWAWATSRLDLNCNEVEHMRFQCGELTFNVVTGNEYGVVVCHARQLRGDHLLLKDALHCRH